jgi:hypothetical protein
MTITLNPIKILYTLLGLLVIFYAANIYITANLSAALIDKPVKIAFVIIQPQAGDCKDCFDPNRVVEMMKTSHNITYKTTVLDYSSPLATKYISMYDIKTLPAVIITGDIANEKLTNAWGVLTAKLVKDARIIENLLPYYDIASATVKGLVAVTVLTDGTCQKCFDAQQYLSMLKRLGLQLGKTNTYDISTAEGKALVEKYNIQKLPTMLISPDVSVYKNFVTAWSEVGTVSDDGWLVLREVQKISPDYKSL